ncbi:hypothetical protein A3F37_03345 [Candidatus Saccharibacteria bacterium RIFCSPHIGHO2_12_FULL_41_12]|nr:MAG: hypothetical protein A3F37_03345 [Candidatus Saccharibacteria bacterium RIFCSPHIGHO2_12_FULL_41_12]
MLEMTGVGENLGEAGPVNYGTIGFQIVEGPEVHDEVVFLNSIAWRDTELLNTYKGFATDSESDDLCLLALPEVETDELKTRLEQKAGVYSDRLWRQYIGEDAPSGSNQEADLTLTTYKRDIMTLLLGYCGASLDKLTEVYGSIEETVDPEILEAAFKDVQKFVNNGCSHVSVGVLATAKA